MQLQGGAFTPLFWLGGKGMQMGGFHWSWSCSREAEGTFASRKKKTKKLWLSEEKKKDTRKRYKVPLPSMKTRERIDADFAQEHGRPLSWFFGESDLLKFRRETKERYDWLEKEGVREKAFF